MFMPGHQNTVRNKYVKIAGEYFENVTDFKYLGTAVTCQNCFHKEIKVN